MIDIGPHLFQVLLTAVWIGGVVYVLRFLLPRL
jgi:hypothetical protein